MMYEKEEMGSGQWLIVVILFTLIGAIVGWGSTEFYMHGKYQERKVIYRDTCLCDTVEKLTEKSLMIAIRLEGIKHPDCVFKQAIWETGHLKSNICKTKNNLFGFCLSDGYINFKNWIESVKYYKSWQDRHYKGGDYFEFLDSIKYSEDSTYTSKIKLIQIKK